MLTEGVGATNDVTWGRAAVFKGGGGGARSGVFVPNDASAGRAGPSLTFGVVDESMGFCTGVGGHMDFGAGVESNVFWDVSGKAGRLKFGGGSGPFSLF